MARVALLTGGPSRVLAPWFDPDWRLAGMNNLHLITTDIPEERFAFWIEIHTPEHLASRAHGAAQLEWLRRPHSFPIFVQDAVAGPEFPSSVPFPMEELRRALPLARFASSADYSIAAALLLGFREIALYGFDGECSATPADVRANRVAVSSYWLGVCEGRGVTVTAPVSKFWK